MVAKFTFLTKVVLKDEEDRTWVYLIQFQKSSSLCSNRGRTVVVEERHGIVADRSHRRTRGYQFVSRSELVTVCCLTVRDAAGCWGGGSLPSPSFLSFFLSMCVSVSQAQP